MSKLNNKIVRCSWPGEDPLYVAYHDEEWGVPVYENQPLFAKLLLDGAQAGLSWIAILRKRANYYAAFDDFNPEKMACYDDAKIAELLAAEIRSGDFLLSQPYAMLPADTTMKPLEVRDKTT